MVRSPECTIDGCRRTAPYGYNKVRLYCLLHKPTDAIYYPSSLCLEQTCTKKASYGFKHTSAKYCVQHKENGMEELYKRICSYPGCDITASKKENGELFCGNHAPTTAIFRKNRNCKINRCKKTASFGYERKNAQYCGKHASNDMIDVLSKLCEHPGCGDYARYGHNRLQFCINHIEPGMTMRGITTCNFMDCTKRAKVGKLFKPRTHCHRHKQTGEYRENYPKCEYNCCETDPYYTDDGTNYPKRCTHHKNPNDKNVIEKPCKSCGLMYYLNEGVDLCEDCGNFQKGVQKVKELGVKTALDDAGIKYTSYDGKIADGCSRYRPDFVIERHMFNIVVECDENQHSSYSPECELARMYQIFQDFGGKSVVFIRFNPDNYTTGVVDYRPSSQRYKELIKSIEYFNRCDQLAHPIQVIHLFYNGYLGNFTRTRELVYENGTCMLLEK